MIDCVFLPFVKLDSLSATKLRPTEIEVIDICVRIAQFLGLSKSVGEIYGLLFVSPAPLSLDILVERLSLSKGSASQGLKQLRSYGAVQSSYVPGDRRDHYIAETNLQTLVAGFLRERVQPGVSDLAERLEQIGNHLPPEERRSLGDKLETLVRWQQQMEKLLPLAQTILGDGRPAPRQP